VLLELSWADRIAKQNQGTSQNRPLNSMVGGSLFKLIMSVTTSKKGVVSMYNATNRNLPSW